MGEVHPGYRTRIAFSSAFNCFCECVRVLLCFCFFFLLETHYISMPVRRHNVSVGKFALYNKNYTFLPCHAGPVSDSPEKTPGMSPRSLSNRSIPGSPSLPESKELVKESKDSSPVSTKKTSLFSSIGHKLTKSKPKAVPVGELAVPASDVTTVGSVEGGFIFVQHGNDSGEFGRPH